MLARSDVEHGAWRRVRDRLGPIDEERRARSPRHANVRGLRVGFRDEPLGRRFRPCIDLGIRNDKSQVCKRVHVVAGGLLGDGQVPEGVERWSDRVRLEKLDARFLRATLGREPSPLLEQLFGFLGGHCARSRRAGPGVRQENGRKAGHHVSSHQRVSFRSSNKGIGGAEDVPVGGAAGGAAELDVGAVSLPKIGSWALPSTDCARGSG